jgi:hypothetical protein
MSHAPSMAASRATSHQGVAMARGPCRAQLKLGYSPRQLIGNMMASSRPAYSHRTGASSLAGDIGAGIVRCMPPKRIVLAAAGASVPAPADWRNAHDNLKAQSVTLQAGNKKVRRRDWANRRGGAESVPMHARPPLHADHPRDWGDRQASGRVHHGHLRRDGERAQRAQGELGAPLRHSVDLPDAPRVVVHACVHAGIRRLCSRPRAAATPAQGTDPSCR